MKIKFSRNIKLIIAGIISVIALAAVGYYSFAKFYLAEDMIEAQKALKSGNYTLAYKLLREVIKNDSSSVEAHTLLAELNEKQGNYLQAVKLWAAVQKLDPFDERAVKKQVENMFSIGAYTAIIELLTTRFNESKCSLSEKLYLAKAYNALGKINNAENIVNEILKNNRNEPSAILLKANIAFYKRNIAKAEKIYNKISTDNKDILSAKYIGLANCYEYMNKQTEAEKLYLKANKLLNNSAQTGLILSNFYIKNNQRKKALDVLKKLYLVNKNNINVILPLADLYLQAGNSQKIKSLKEGITKSGILYIQLKYFLDALLFFQERKYAKALKYFEWAGDKFKNNSAYRTCTVYSFIKTENTIETAKYLKSILNSQISRKKKINLLNLL